LLRARAGFFVRSWFSNISASLLTHGAPFVGAARRSMGRRRARDDVPAGTRIGRRKSVADSNGECTPGGRHAIGRTAEVQWVRAGTKPAGNNALGRDRRRRGGSARRVVGAGRSGPGRRMARSPVRGVGGAGRCGNGRADRSRRPHGITRRLEEKAIADRIAVCSWKKSVGDRETRADDVRRPSR